MLKITSSRYQFYLALVTTKLTAKFKTILTEPVAAS